MMFPPELRTMAFVPRWPIVMTTLKDNIATHSFFVATYAYLIARLIGWKGPFEYLMLNALMHDNDETISGDITGPVKKLIIGDQADEVLRQATEERMGGLIEAFYELEDRQSDQHIREADRIVRAADLMDAYLFLLVNYRMGNTTVMPALDGNLKGLEAAWRALPAPQEILDKTWQTDVVPSLKEHEGRGGRGFSPGVKL